MNEFFDIVENYLKSGKAEDAFTLLQQVNDSSERYVQLNNACRQALESQYMAQIQQSIAAGDNATAQAAIDLFRAKLGSTPAIDALASVIAAPAAPAQPTPQPVVPPTPEPAPAPVVPLTPEVVPPTPQPVPEPVAPPTPQPAPEPSPVVPPTPQPVPVPPVQPVAVPQQPQPVAPQPTPQPAPQFAPIPEPTYGPQPAFTPEQPAEPKKKSKKGLWITLIIIAVLLIGCACSYFFIDPVKKFVNNTLGIASDSTAVVDSTAVKSSPDEYEDEDDGGYEDEDEWETDDNELGNGDEDEYDEPKPEDFPGGLADDGLGPDEDEFGNPKTQPTPLPTPQPTPQPEAQPIPQPAPATGPAPKGEPTSREFSSMMSYLRNNTRSVGTTGRVNVEFVVEANGTCSNVRVTRGLNAAANAEAIRLIQNMRIGNSSGRRYTYSAFVDFR